MKIEKLIKWVSLVLSICGLLLIFFPIQGMLILTRIAGVLLITLTVLGIFRQKAGTLISGSSTLSFLSTTLGLILGVVLLIYPVETKSALTIIAGILIFVNALRVAYLSYKEHLRGSGIMLASALVLCLIACFLMAKPSESITVLYRLIGACLSVSGAFHLLAIYIDKQRVKTEDADVIDIEVKNVRK